MNKKIQLSLILLLVTFGLVSKVHSQVTIGAGTEPQSFSILELVSNRTGGLRLPVLTTEERTDIIKGISEMPNGVAKNTALAEVKGLTIYNTSTNCHEYWNGIRWVSLCEGNSQVVMDPLPCGEIDADGTGCQNEFTVSDPDCINGPFTFTVVSGSDYASIYAENGADGSFKVSFQPNNSKFGRSAIIRVTSSCNGLYKDFLFTQEGQGCDDTLGTAPSITSYPSGKAIDFCVGGAVYLSVPANTPHLDELIWTRNGIEVARGVNFLNVTQAGIYDVWLGIIGCNALGSNAVTVSKGGLGAPEPVSIVAVGNNGVVCGSTGKSKLIAQKTASGKVRWFKDGILQDDTSPKDNEIEAGIGQWYAVVEDGSCWSRPSQIVTIVESASTGAALTPPVIKAGGSFCAGGSVQLSVSDDTYNSSYTYTWYENNTELGTGRHYLYQVPAQDTDNLVIRCRATKSQSCAVEEMSSVAVVPGTIPARPVITGDTKLCSGKATLNVIPSGAGNYQYSWFKDGEQIGSSQSITVNAGGDYFASVTEVGKCTSPMVQRTIDPITSATPTVTLIRSNETPNQFDVVTYAATIDFGPALSYNWNIVGGVPKSGGTPSSPNAVVSYDNVGPAKVEVSVTNACGTGSDKHDIANVATACADPDIVFPNTQTDVFTVVDQDVQLGPVSVTFTEGTPSASYQWYRNTTASVTGATQVTKDGTNNTLVARESSPGIYYYFCEVTNAGCTTALKKISGFYELTVSKNPSEMELGAGSFLGQSCFDINKSNFGDGCGAEDVRRNTATDFSTLGEVSYTFEASSTGTVQDLRFIIIDTEGLVESYTGGKSGPLYNNEKVVLKVKYKSTLSDVGGVIYGRTRVGAAKVKIFAVYNDGSGPSGDASIPLTVHIQDCICCPGYLATGGEYKSNYTKYLLPTSTIVNFAALQPHFIATGKDLCVYKADADKGTATAWGNHFGSGDKCQTLATYTDEDAFKMGSWRAPHVIELGALQDVAATLATQANSAAGTANLSTSRSYWSINENSTTKSWSWSYSLKAGQASIKNNNSYFVRCVRSF